MASRLPLQIPISPRANSAVVPPRYLHSNCQASTLRHLSNGNYEPQQPTLWLLLQSSLGILPYPELRFVARAANHALSHDPLRICEYFVITRQHVSTSRPDSAVTACSCGNPAVTDHSPRHPVTPRPVLRHLVPACS